ncbi:nuclear transport factor 2 family protein [Agromyces albus]|uniref:nuclear transport factor 2 family protein n=1 Tax=Agromyces albus TaxID=205332 RepID=UPI00277D3CAF|nr:nuclear transport factor 2 family protein [Agromyces albus]MDQ0575605.1 ketosteroid isomerase-like protein [Agromyces albus]
MSGRETIEALIAPLNAGDVDGMDAVFHEDAVMEWPQSGERIVGGENRRGVYRAFPQLPKITPRRGIRCDELLPQLGDQADGAARKA